MKKLFLALIIISALFLLLAPLYAFTHRSGDSVSITTEIADDVYALGNSISLLADIPEDLIAAGGNIKVNGNVGKDLIAAGGMMDVSGSIGDDARIAGGIVNINSHIADDLIVAGGRVVIGSEAVIGKDLVVSGGTVSIEGDIKGRVFANGGTIDIMGEVAKEVIIDDVGKLNIGPTAVLGADLTYSSTTEASIADGAQISGNVNFNLLEEPAARPRVTPAAPLALFTATYIGGKVISFLSLFVLGILLILALPKVFERFNARMSSTLGNCVGAGAITLFGAPLVMLILLAATVFLFITVIGSGAALMMAAVNAVLAILYLVLVYTSTVFLSYLVGTKILSNTSLDLNRYGWKVVAYLIGLVIICIAFAIPFIGWLARMAAALFGLGGLALALKDWLSLACKRK